STISPFLKVPLTSDDSTRVAKSSVRRAQWLPAIIGLADSTKPTPQFPQKLFPAGTSAPQRPHLAVAASIAAPHSGQYLAPRFTSCPAGHFVENTSNIGYSFAIMLTTSS